MMTGESINEKLLKKLKTLFDTFGGFVINLLLTYFKDVNTLLYGADSYIFLTTVTKF